MQNALLIHYDFCSGCQTCEVACKKEKNLPEGVFGIKVAQYGPVEYAPKKWDMNYVPVPTSCCDLCADRVASGKIPSCVLHCQSKVMHYGPIDELVKLAADKDKVVIFVPQRDL